MPQEKRLYSTRTIVTYCEYLKKQYPNIDIQPILEHAGITPEELREEGYYLTQTQINRFHEKMDEVTGDPGISRAAGRYSFESRATSNIRDYLFGFVDMATAFSLTEKTIHLFTRATVMNSRRISEDEIEIVTTPMPGTQERPFQCENRMGCYEALARFYTGHYPEIRHEECMHKGGQCCRYTIVVGKSKSSSWRRVQRLVSLIAIPWALSYFFLSFYIWLFLLPVYLAILGGVSFYVERLAKRELENRMEPQKNTAMLLLDQINKDAHNAQLIQDIGQAISNLMDLDEFLRHVMDAFMRHQGYDRGSVFLTNDSKTRLVFRAGFGYDPEYENYLRQLEFNLGGKSVNSPFNEALRERKQIIVDNIKTIEGVISPKTMEFIRIMQVESFICVPIVHKGEPMGVLVVDNVNTKRALGQNDLNLLMGVANQIAVSISNVQSYQQIRESYRKVMESEESFRSLSENAPEIIFAVDETRRITYVNQVWNTILGHTKEMVLGHKVDEFTKKESAKAFNAAFDTLLESSESPGRFEGTMIAQNGAEKYFSINCARNPSQSGQSAGLIAILTDISENRMLEAQLRQAQKMEAIGTLAGGIAHDFNNIMAAIIGYTEMSLEDTQPQSRTHGYLEQVKASSKRAKDLVRQILTFSRQGEQELKPLKVVPIVKETLKLIRASIPATISIKAIVRGNHTVLADPTQIHQIVMNLCMNSVQAMPNGGEMTVEVESVTELPPTVSVQNRADSYVRLTVSDVGHGIPSHMIGRIFDPFFTTKNPGDGTGLGLSVVHGIVSRHNGAIHVSSTPRKGATISIFFPELPEELVCLPAEETTPVIGGTECILLVDDESSLVRMNKELLRRLGYTVIGFTDPVKALESFEKNPGRYDLLLTDLTMPNMTGTELARAIIDIRPEIPVIICTGYGQSLSLEQAKHMGIRNIVLKPVVKQEIAASIRKALSEQHACAIND